ncbi:MAG: site-2 protease family protein [Gemmatales bacterium]|nr:site-2 protease family protein [Gemmatales bacterium]MDW8176541.1 site-2 protease family protein [Gemmatales bacterium]
MPLGMRIAVLLGLIVAMVLRSWVEAWVAVWQGDDGPRQAGQTTLDPRAHVDWLGTMVLPLLVSLSGSQVLFAFPKPLQLDLLYHPSPYRLVFFARLAGCVFHFVLAALLILFLRPLLEALPPNPAREKLVLFFLISAISNLGVAFILLLPIPPATGALLLGWLLPRGWREHLIFNTRLIYAGILLLLIALMLPSVQKLILAGITDTLELYFKLLAVPAEPLLAILRPR